MDQMKHLLDIPGYDVRAFMPVCGRMRLYGKSDAPPAPDYIGQANATAAGNLANARATTSANRVNQSTPYGNIKYTQGTGFDQAGYDAAMAQYKQQKSVWDDPNNSVIRRDNPGGPTAVDRNQFVTNPDQWASSIELSDSGQKLLDQYNKTSLGMAGLQDQAMDRVRDAQSQPFDTSGLIDINSQTGMDAWNKASQLIKDRNAGSLNSQQAALDAKLANQGLTAGSEGWGIQQQQFGRQRNDADMAAEMAGLQAQNQFFNQGIAGNQATLQQRNFLRQMPLNELNALRTGSQVTNPTFANAPTQGQTPGADLLGASGQQYNAALGQTNANNQAAANTTSGVVGAIGTALSFY